MRSNALLHRQFDPPTLSPLPVPFLFPLKVHAYVPCMLHRQFDPQPCPPCLSHSLPLQGRADALLLRQYELVDCIGWLSDVGRWGSPSR